MMERSYKWIVEQVNGHLVPDTTEQNSMIRGVSTDTRQLQANQLYIPLIGEQFDGHNFLSQAMEKGATLAFWQQDHPLPETLSIPLVLVEDTLLALQQLAHAYRQELEIPVVAVTGSNGKTTTKDLLAAVLGSRFRLYKTKGNLNNHIGVPLTLLSISEQAEVAVVEMGMNHAGEIEILSQMARPTAAVITNIGESHIEFLGSRRGIAQAKLEVTAGLSADGPIFYDGDEPLLQELLITDSHPHVRIGWGTEMDEFPTEIQMAGFSGTSFRSGTKETLFHLSLLGKHNIKNALLAVSVARHLGLTEQEIAEGLTQVTSTGMRLEMVTGKNGLHIINDAYNASPTSMRAGLDLLAEMEPQLEKWALLGDIREIGSEEERYHRELGAYAINKGINRLYTIGERGRWIAEGARTAEYARVMEDVRKVNPERLIFHFTSYEQAIQVLEREGHDGVLLLVKASRGAELDRVVKPLIERE